jgi:hypothetical protein
MERRERAMRSKTRADSATAASCFMDWFTADQVSRTPLYYIKPAITNGIASSKDAAAGPGPGFFNQSIPVAPGSPVRLPPGTSSTLAGSPPGPLTGTNPVCSRAWLIMLAVSSMPGPIVCLLKPRKASSWNGHKELRRYPAQPASLPVHRFAGLAVFASRTGATTTIRIDRGVHQN